MAVSGAPAHAPDPPDPRQGAGQRGRAGRPGPDPLRVARELGHRPVRPGWRGAGERLADLRAGPRRGRACRGPRMGGDPPRRPPDRGRPGRALGGGGGGDRGRGARHPRSPHPGHLPRRRAGGFRGGFPGGMGGRPAQRGGQLEGGSRGLDRNTRGQGIEDLGRPGPVDLVPAGPLGAGRRNRLIRSSGGLGRENRCMGGLPFP